MKLKITSIALIALAVLIVGLVRVEAGDSSRPLTLAHRGANLEEDEDTLEAYELAADYGMDMIETDPRLTADGHWVIMHDMTVDRTTDGIGPVDRMTFPEIKALKTISRGRQVPTLEEVLELAHDRRIGVYLDMKIIPPRWADFIALLDRHDMRDNVILGLWWKGAVREVESQWPEMVTTISWPRPVLKIKGAKKLGADYVGTLRSLASKRMIIKSHKLGLKTVTMPINTEKEMRKFIGRGLDILQTDDPRILVKMGVIVPRKGRNTKFNPFDIERVVALKLINIVK